MNPKTKIKPILLILFFYLVIILYPVLPDYTRLFNMQLYLIIIVIFLGLFIYHITFVDEIKLNLYWVKNYYFIFLITIIGLIPYLYHLEIMQGVKFIFEYLFLYTALFYVLSKFNLTQKVLKILVFVGFLVSLFGLIEFVFKFNVFSLIENYAYALSSFGSATKDRLGLTRIEQSFNTPITYAVYLSFLLVISIYLIVNEKSEKLKKFYILTLLLFNINIILTFSRGPIVFIFLIQTIFFFMSSGKVKLKILIALIPATAILVLVIQFNDTLKTQLSSFIKMIVILFDTNTSSLGDSSLNIDNPLYYRLLLPKTIFNLLEGHWLFGFGYTESVSFYIKEIGITNQSIDNGYLSLLVDGGIFGLTSILLSIFIPLFLAFKNIRKKKLRFILNDFSIDHMFIFVAIIYLLNLFSVARMAEYRLYMIIMFVYMAYYIKTNIYEKNILKSRRICQEKENNYLS